MVFISNDHIVYENGRKTSGHYYGQWRQIQLRKFIGDVYRFNISRLHPDHLRETGKIVSQPLLLRQQDPGFMRLAEEKHELLVWLDGSRITEARWTYNHRSILFIKAPDKKILKAINIPVEFHLNSVQPGCRDGLIERYQSILRAMEKNEDATLANASYYLFLGQSLFRTGVYREAKEAFTQCSMTLLFNGHTPWHESIYWFARVSEQEGNTREARQFYQLAIERYKEGANKVSREQIEAALVRLDN